MALVSRLLFCDSLSFNLQRLVSETSETKQKVFNQRVHFVYPYNETEGVAVNNLRALLGIKFRGLLGKDAQRKSVFESLIGILQGNSEMSESLRYGFEGVSAMDLTKQELEHLSILSNFFSDLPGILRTSLNFFVIPAATPANLIFVVDAETGISLVDILERNSIQLIGFLNDPAFTLAQSQRLSQVTKEIRRISFKELSLLEITEILVPLQEKTKLVSVSAITAEAAAFFNRPGLNFTPEIVIRSVKLNGVLPEKEIQMFFKTCKNFKVIQNVEISTQISSPFNYEYLKWIQTVLSKKIERIFTESITEKTWRVINDGQMFQGGEGVLKWGSVSFFRMEKIKELSLESILRMNNFSSIGTLSLFDCTFPETGNVLPTRINLQRGFTCPDELVISNSKNLDLSFLADSNFPCKNLKSLQISNSSLANLEALHIPVKNLKLSGLVHHGMKISSEIAEFENISETISFNDETVKEITISSMTIKELLARLVHVPLPKSLTELSLTCYQVLFELKNQTGLDLLSQLLSYFSKLPAFKRLKINGYLPVQGLADAAKLAGFRVREEVYDEVQEVLVFSKN
jgi:hypothetical protein